MRGAISAAAVLLLPLILTGRAAAQTTTAELSAQNLRPYWQVFIAYGIAWLLIGGWLFSVGKRLGRIEHDLMK
jgi:CcmD family protein